MSWLVDYSAKARQDLRDIYQYIAQELREPSIAEKQTRRIIKAIRDLDEMPHRHQPYPESPWFDDGLRFFAVDNYLVFYLPDKGTNTVDIVRIMYTHRDVGNQLTTSKEDGTSD